MRGYSRRCFALLLCVLAPLASTAGAADAASGIRAISAAENTACALRGDGALFCWGRSENGQVGAGRKADKEPYPIEVVPGGVSAVSVGYAHVCAVAGGALSCWGWNASGQVGTRKGSDPVLTPTRVIDRGVSAVAAGGMHTCAVVDGALLCWGDNGYGEIGNGEIGNGGACCTQEPARIFESGVTAVSAQAQNTCAIVRGALWCWGDNRSGQVGNGLAGAPVERPFKVIERDVEAVAVGKGYVCAVVAKALECWGGTRDGFIGRALEPERRLLVPGTVIAAGVTAVAAGAAHVCAIVDGAMQCWGYSSNGDIRAGNATSVARPETVIPRGVSAVAVADGVTCAVVDGALRCRGYDGYGTALTTNHGASHAFDVADGDVRVLDRSAANAADARARLPGEVAQYLVGKLVTDGKTAYVVTRASGKVDKDIHDQDAYTRMTLDVVALYALDHEEPAYGDRASAPIAAAIPSAASCGREIDLNARLDDHVPFLVLKDDRFVAVNTATDGRFAKLAPFASGGTLLDRTLQLGAADLGKLRACAKEMLARIEKQPLAGVTLYASDTLLARVPATPDAEWSTGALGDAPVSRIVIEPRNGTAADYAIDVRVNSSMVCGGDLVLANWKHGRSIPWQLERSGNAFEANRGVLDKEAPQFPRYTMAELRAAIDEARRAWHMEKPIDPSTCADMLTGETYTIHKGPQVVQQIEIGYRQPAPIVPFDCEGGRASLAVHVAGDLGYAVSGWDSDSYMLCKAMPDQPDASIVALAIAQERGEEPADRGIGLYDLDVSVVDTRTRHVLARSLEKAAFASDAWRFNGVSIDTGRYRLAKDVRAFGIRAGWGGSSRYSPAMDTGLSLYVRDGKRLRRVLGLLAYAVRGEYDDDCSGSSTTLERTIDIAPTLSHGFADLVVTSKVTEREMRKGDGSDGDCKEVERPAGVTRTTLHYDGRKYVVPDALQTFN
jgi:hypothetical protein